MIRKITLAACLSLLLPLVANAQQLYTAGQDYAVLDTPVRTRDSNKIEVVEVFWYGCSHCYTFEPLVAQWKKSLASDVDFWQSPAIWRPVMSLHAQAFYAAQALGVADKMQAPLFTALAVEHKPLSSEAQIEDLFASHGVDREDFRKAFNSFGVKSQVKQADARQRSFGVTGTPELVVNGKYRVSSRLPNGGNQSQVDMLKMVDYLVAQERAAKPAAADKGGK
jgi:thiol:disulfide interchange protein DsbA